MQYKTGAERNLREIAAALGVAHVLEGTVQRAGGRVRVNAQLIDARTDSQLWAERYDRDVADVFAIESELAGKIVAQLQAKISPSEKAAIEQKPTADLVAHDLSHPGQNAHRHFCRLQYASTREPVGGRSPAESSNRTRSRLRACLLPTRPGS